MKTEIDTEGEHIFLCSHKWVKSAETIHEQVNFADGTIDFTDPGLDRKNESRANSTKRDALKRIIGQPEARPA